ncbi:MAG TPA: hypothetical protein VK469_01315 [Candidatus Kapabacteria bacterium]|nr:hypothetical protein [Candidatus Kapabacteria bacterium]
MQNNYFLQITDYSIYSQMGIKGMFLSSPLSVIYGNAIVPSDLISKIDPVVLLNLLNNVKGKALSPGNLNFKIDFSSIVLLFLALLALYYGFEAMQDREYLKFRASIKSPRKIFFGVICSKFILFMLAFLILHAILIGQMQIYGIHLSTLDYAALVESLPAAILMMLFFFVSGVLIGTLRLKGFNSALSIFSTWFIFIYIFPGVINFQVENLIPETTEDYQTELEKFSIVVQFEKSFTDKHGLFKRSKIEVARNFIERYWNDDYKQIEAREENLKKKFDNFVDDYHFISMFSPTTNYLSTVNEVSSRGYENFMDYYRFNQDLQRKFVRFYIDRTFYNDPRIMVNFLDNEDPIYRGKSRLPRYFYGGILVNSFYCILLLFVAYYLYKKYMFPMPKNAEVFKKMDFNFDKGKSHAIQTTSPDFIDLFLNPFFGINKDFPGKIAIDGKSILTSDKKDILYLPNIEKIPEDIPVKSILKLFNVKSPDFAPIVNKKFGQLKTIEKSELLLSCAQLKQSRIIIFNDFLFAPPAYKDTYVKRIKTLKENSILIYLGPLGRPFIQQDTDFMVLSNPDTPGCEIMDMTIKD